MMIFLMLAEIMFTFENFGEREREKMYPKILENIERYVRKTTNVIKKEWDTEIFVDLKYACILNIQINF